jgi:transposase InsO family protein
MEKQDLTKRYPGLDEKGLEIALARHAAVAWMEGQQQAGLSREACYRLASAMEWRGRRFGQSTLEKYWKWFRSDGFEGLLPNDRSDAGKSRVLSPEFLKILDQRRRQNPRQSIKELLRELVRDGLMQRVGWGNLASIYRHLRRVGLDNKTLQILGPSGPTKAFEVMTANDLWMIDVMHGPVVVGADGRKIMTRLIAIIDDASRLVPYAEYRENEREEDFWIVLLEAIQRRGLPSRLYTDNAKIFISLRTQATCARLGIKLIHAKPYAAWSKGKIEKWLQTTQSQFQNRLLREPAKSLEELNLRFWQWVEGEYHIRNHGGLDNKSPQARFAEDNASIRLLDRQQLEGCFWQEEKRRVRRDATVLWRGAQWEVPVFLRGMQVTLRYNPLKPDDPIEIWHERRLCGQLRKLDRQLNSRTFSHRENYS